MMVTSQMIQNGLEELGLSKGDHVMVHSSLSSFGYVDGGADTVVDAILNVIGSEGTLLVPTSIFNGSVTLFLRDLIKVDLRTEPSLLGKITETVRLRKDSKRSIHPSHPVSAIGKLAEELLSEHHLGNSPIGDKSPYGKLAEIDNGKILLIGVGNSNNSTIHCLEEYYTPYIFNGETFLVKVFSESGEAYHVHVKGYCVNKARNFTAMDPFLVKAGFMNKVKIGESTVTLVNAPGLMKVGKDLLMKDPFFLLKDKKDILY